MTVATPTMLPVPTVVLRKSTTARATKLEISLPLYLLFSKISLKSFRKTKTYKDHETIVVNLVPEGPEVD